MNCIIDSGLQSPIEQKSEEEKVDVKLQVPSVEVLQEGKRQQ